MDRTVKCAFLLRSTALKCYYIEESAAEPQRVLLHRDSSWATTRWKFSLQSVLFLTLSKMEIIKSIKTWKPLKKSKSSQSQNKASASGQGARVVAGLRAGKPTTSSDSVDHYCYERRSQTSLESEGQIYSPSTRPSSQPLYSRPPLSKPPADFLQPKVYQGKNRQKKKNIIWMIYKMVVAVVNLQFWVLVCVFVRKSIKNVQEV